MADDTTNEPEETVDELRAKAADEDLEDAKDAGEGVENAGEAAGDPEPPVEDDLPAALEKARADVEELKDKALRAHAEMENVRRRAARDIEGAHKFALERFAADLLPVLDSLEKAVEGAATAVDANAVGEGVDLSLKLFVTTLVKNGVELLDPLGEPFDPARHEAIAMVENLDAEPNSVMDVMQKGYLLNGRLVRAAKVIVVKAPGDEGAGDASEKS